MSREEEIVREKIFEALDRYYTYIQDDHPKSIEESRKKAEEYHDELLRRYHDFLEITEMPRKDWELDYNDYS